jgi:hypothetical protein
MKKISFLSFGHWTPSSQSQTRYGHVKELRNQQVPGGKSPP